MLRTRTRVTTLLLTLAWAPLLISRLFLLRLLLWLKRVGEVGGGVACIRLARTLYLGGIARNFALILYLSTFLLFIQ